MNQYKIVNTLICFLCAEGSTLSLKMHVNVWSKMQLVDIGWMCMLLQSFKFLLIFNKQNKGNKCIPLVLIMMLLSWNLLKFCNINVMWDIAIIIVLYFIYKYIKREILVWIHISMFVKWLTENVCWRSNLFIRMFYILLWMIHVINIF